MTAGNWTPGPRRVVVDDFGVEVEAMPIDGVWVTVARHGRVSVAGEYSTDDDLLPNAHLHAAAPRLVDELQRLVTALEPLERGGGWPLDRAGVATLNGARAALAKAHGEQQ